MKSDGERRIAKQAEESPVASVEFRVLHSMHYIPFIFYESVVSAITHRRFVWCSCLEQLEPAPSP